MSAVLKLVPRSSPNPATKEQRDLDVISRGLKQVDREGLQIVRLHWHEPFLERIERTEGTDRAVIYNDSTLTRRMIMMAKGRLQRRYQIRTLSNPYTSTVAVWVQRRAGS